MPTSRRRFLATTSVTVTGAFAGCSGGGGGDSNVPNPDANPKDLLPTAPEGWTITTRANQQYAGMIGADAGYARSFDAPPDGAHYAVEFYRFPSGSDAEAQADVFADWSAYVVRGNFGFAAKGPDMEKVYLMLGHSSALTEAYARENNMV